MIPTEITALINLIGAPAVFVLLLILRDWAQGKSSSKQENAITDLALDSNTERKERQAVIDGLQKSNNHLQAEIFTIQLKQAEESGRREEIKEAMQRERDEWKAERIANDEKFRLMAIDISELKKHREQSTLRISELESQIAELEKKLATANVEIDILQAQKRELEAQLERERNRADTLNNLVTQIRAIENTVPTDATQAIPDMRDVDDTIHPLPQAVSSETSLPENEPAPPDAA
jgi:chromosome segregation ATPase